MIFCWDKERARDFAGYGLLSDTLKGLTQYLLHQELSNFTPLLHASLFEVLPILSHRL